MAGPAGLWCRICGKYQSIRTKAQSKSARAHGVACQSSNGFVPEHVGRPENLVIMDDVRGDHIGEDPNGVYDDRNLRRGEF